MPYYNGRWHLYDERERREWLDARCRLPAAGFRI